MESTQRLILAAAPAALSAAGRWGLPLAHLAYRVGSGPHLFRANAPVAPRGGLMGVDAPRFEGGQDVVGFCNEVLRECTARKFSGVVCRFGPRRQPALEEISAKLGEVCAQRGLSCYVSESYGAAAPQARVIIHTAISGGSLRSRLEEAQGRFGPERVAVWADRSAEDFPLPSPTGTGERLTLSELERCREERGGSVFFDDDLCARYFTYMAGERGHFVLFDDADSIRKKLRLAGELGIGTVFLAYEEASDLLGEILGR